MRIGALARSLARVPPACAKARRTFTNVKTFSKMTPFSNVRAAAARLPVPREHACLSMREGQQGWEHACSPSDPRACARAAQGRHATRGCLRLTKESN